MFGQMGSAVPQTANGEVATENATITFAAFEAMKVQDCNSLIKGQSQEDLEALCRVLLRQGYGGEVFSLFRELLDALLQVEEAKRALKNPEEQYGFTGRAFAVASGELHRKQMRLGEIEQALTAHYF